MPPIIEAVKDAATSNSQPTESRSEADHAAVATKLRDAQPGDILLFNHAKGWNRLITWLTKSRYYHVGIYQGNNHVVEARPRGVVSRDLNGPDDDRYFDVIPAPQDKGAAALAWAESKIGAGYDKSDAVAITLEQLFKLRCACLNFSSQRKFSCGEFVTQAFREAGAYLFPNREPQEIVPADFEPMLTQR